MLYLITFLDNMKGFLATAVVIASLVPNAFAHYRWTSLILNGAATPEWQYVRPPGNVYSNSPVTDVSSRDFTCNTGSKPVAGVATVSAGSTIGFKLDQAIYHAGVINVYLGKAPSGSTAATWDGSGKSWFKVAQLSAVTNGGSSITFPSDNLTQYTFRIPSSVSAGDYLARIEHIALHGASSYPGAQFYISCAQLKITGGGGGNPPTVSIPGVYTGQEPGIKINIYYPIPATYVQPGPAVWSG
ncbi:hypothetical protein FRC03_002724 [Tulasnella sp. 419]|nr:hypothetical protein FRC02_010247 [Tulasnella sp. 418]KAG8942974.1 hypothetical protein FRC03_002724 [Tulasnella sp. 419]